MKTLILILLFPTFTLAAEIFKPKEGYVPDEKTAIRIALAVMEPIYGKETIDRQKPHKAVMVEGVWMVSGTLPPNTPGGVAMAEIRKDDAQVVRVLHGQ